MARYSVGLLSRKPPDASGQYCFSQPLINLIASLSLHKSPAAGSTAKTALNHSSGKLGKARTCGRIQSGEDCGKSLNGR